MVPAQTCLPLVLLLVLLLVVGVEPGEGGEGGEVPAGGEGQHQRPRPAH